MPLGPCLVASLVLSPWMLQGPAADPFASPQADPAPETSDDTTVAVGTGARAPDRFIEEVEAPAADGPPPVPRLLESIYQIRAGEAKEYSNAAGTVTFVPGLQFRNQVSYVSPFTLDQEGNRFADPAQATGRIRISPELRLGKKQNISIFGQIDFANGRWTPLGSEDPVIAEILYPGGDTVAVGQPPGRQYLRPVDARHLYLQWTTKVGQLRIGQMGFTWGQGILANDGNNVDRFGDMRFGDDGPGDIYERVLFGTRPFTPLGGAAENILVAIGADLVYRDERIDLVGSDFQDIGAQVFFVLRYEDPDDPNNWFGGYAVYRNQRNADDNDPYDDDTDLVVGAGDIAGQGVLEFDNDFAFLGAFEGALIGGKTTAAWNSEFAEHRVLQGGLAARAYFGKPDIWLAGMDFGYASGDGNPSDGEINNFTFDAGHSVGMVLFQHVNGWRTAQSEILATNGELTGEPINGSQFIPTRGAVTNAVYFHPKARYALDDVFEIWGGPLFALAPDDITDPYATRLNGGTGTNSLGGDGSRRFYGSELDIGLRARYEFKKIWFQAGVQAGYLIPGLGLADASGDKGNPIFATQLRTELRY